MLLQNQVNSATTRQGRAGQDIGRSRLTNRRGQRETWSGDGFQRRRAQVEARRFGCHARNEEPRLAKRPCVSDGPIHRMHAAQTRREKSRGDHRHRPRS